MENNIEVKVSEGVKELVIRKGEAAKVVPFRESISVKGDLSTPYNYLKNAPNWFTQVMDAPEVAEQKEFDKLDAPLDYSELYVDYDNGEITLLVDAGAVWQSQYKGVLEIDKIFKLFKINTGAQFTTFELADLFKMNRSFFETKDAAMKIVSELTNFKAKVNKIIEDADDSRGNKTVLHAQAVESNIPAAFQLNIPIFKGFPKHAIQIEISINSRDLSCTLISPEANDIINETKQDLINKQLELIAELYPTLKVFSI